MKKGMKNRIIAALMALAMVVTVWTPTQQVKADDSNLASTSTNTSFATARTLTFNTTIAEELSSSDNKRYYKFTISEASELNIGGTSNSLHTKFYIYDATKTQIYYKSVGYTYAYTTGSIYLTGGTYYLMLEQSNTVSFTATIDTMDESFNETQDSNNDTVSAASSISLLTTYKGILAQNDDVDYYKFTVPSSGRINFNMSNVTNGTLKYVIYDSSVNLTYSNTVSSGSKASEYITITKGTYYLAITKNDNSYGVGSYSFNLDYVANKLTAPKITSVKNSSSKKITVKWGAVSGADGYELQYSTKKNFSSGVVTKKVSSSKTSVKCTKLKKGKTYYVRMRAYTNEDGEKTYSSWSSKKKVKIKK